MKSGSKAQKLAAKRARRGRPFTQGVAREPNGRISRAVNPPEPADRLALDVRARMMGVDVEQARDPRLATYIGRLAILGSQAGGISMAQYGAALRFLAVVNDYRKAIDSPLAVWHEGQGWGMGLSADEAAKQAVARYREIMAAVQMAQVQTPPDNLLAALQYLVVDDLELPHMVGALRLALNALARHFS